MQLGRLTRESCTVSKGNLREEEVALKSGKCSYVYNAHVRQSTHGALILFNIYGGMRSHYTQSRVSVRIFERRGKIDEPCKGVSRKAPNVHVAYLVGAPSCKALTA